MYMYTFINNIDGYRWTCLRPGTGPEIQNKELVCVPYDTCTRFLFAVIVGQWRNSFHTEGSSYSLKPENSSFDVLFGSLIVNQLCSEKNMALLMGSVVSRRLRGWPKEAAWMWKTIGEDMVGCASFAIREHATQLSTLHQKGCLDENLTERKKNEYIA